MSDNTDQPMVLLEHSETCLTETCLGVLTKAQTGDGASCRGILTAVDGRGDRMNNRIRFLDATITSLMSQGNNYTRDGRRLRI